jgi:hypothetical protein
MLQLPLYTIWRTGTASEIAFALAHCTVGDALIAAASLGAAVALVGRGWPEAGYRRVAAAAITLGVGYTIFSEYWNVSVRGSWSYAGWMPTVPWVGTGLAPLLQWLVIPTVVFRYRRRRQIAFPVRA